MKAGRSGSWRLAAAIVLAVIIIIGGAVIWRHNRDQRGIEVSLEPAPTAAGRIYLGGAVNNPGWYPLFSTDNLGALILAAGGLQPGADVSSVQLTIGPPADADAPQKIDINRAAAWLLEALPGVGETRAQAVIEYREQHGFFHDTGEIMQVPGFGPSTYDAIKDLITVND